MHSPAPTRGDDGEREQRPLAVVHLLGATGEEIGGDDHHDQLHELRRLDAEPADADPRTGTVDAAADDRRERAEHRRHAEHAERDPDATPERVRDLAP